MRYRQFLIGGLSVAFATVASFAASAVELPKGYRVVEYIENTGYEYFVDSGYVPTENTRIVADLLSTQEHFVDWGVFFGTTAGDSAQDGLLLRHMMSDRRTAVNAWFCNATNEETVIDNVADKRMLVELKKGELKVNGETAAISSTGTPYEGPIYIFCANNRGLPWRYQMMKLYSFKIYEGEELKQDLVPCVRESDEQPGLYDLVEDRFKPLTVSEYIELEYIESSDGAYIDTGYIHTAKTKIECVMEAPLAQPGPNAAVFGARNGRTGANTFAFCIPMGFFQCFRGSYLRGNGRDQSDELRSNYKTTLTCDGRNAFWGSNWKSINLTLPEDTALDDGVNTLFIFDANNGGPGEKVGGQWSSNVLLYSFKIYEGEELKRDFVPCMARASGLLGLYEKMTGKFFTNAGKGYFKRSKFGWRPFGDELETGTYTFTDNVKYGAPMLESALKIKPGATVTLHIPAGVNVSLWGGNADHEKGAGAGIELPADATLKLAGEGTLEVHGGDGGHGADGTDAGNGRVVFDPDWYYSGEGGNGGQGGGGAGAGIGGRGGDGGAGGAGGAGVNRETSREQSDGNAGQPGSSGTPGGDCGTIIAMSTLKINAYGGHSGGGGRGGAGGEWDAYSWSNWYVGYGGGGGGGGGGGMYGASIGGGGGGAGGGAGGGSGSCAWFGSGRSEAATKHTGFGAGGLGGLGGENGENGKNKNGTWASIRSDKESFERGSVHDNGQPDGAASGLAGAAGAWGQKGTKSEWKTYVYRDENNNDRFLTAPYEILTESTTKITEDWGIVTDSITLDSLSIDGNRQVNLLLMDGATLLLKNSFEYMLDTTLNVFAQRYGTGALKVEGSLGSGLRGADGHSGVTLYKYGNSIAEECSGKTGWPGGGLNVYGGNLTVKGNVCCGADGGNGGFDCAAPNYERRGSETGYHSNGGNGGWGGSVKIVRGSVDFGSNVCCGGNGGNSGTVQHLWSVAGWVGTGGNGGTFSVHAGNIKIAGEICRLGVKGIANDRGLDNSDGQPGTIELTGGYYNFRPEAAWCHEPSYIAVLTGAPAMKDEYPWTVVEGREVTIGETPHMTAVWTRSGSALTNEITGTTFTVPYLCSDLKIIFTPDPCYDLDYSTINISGPIRDAYRIVPNSLPKATKARARVTFAFEPERMMVAWTDGVTTNRIEESEFFVPNGTDVMLIFLPEEGCRIEGNNTLNLGVVSEDRVIEHSNEIPKAVVDLPEEYEPLDYIESTKGGKQYIDTLYRPTDKTYIWADIRLLEKSEDWAVLFGVTGSDSSKDGVLLRYMNGDNPKALNAWFCNEDYGEAKIDDLYGKRVEVELKAGELTVNEQQTAAITTTGTPYNGSIYLFCGNNGGSAWRHQAMRLHLLAIADEIEGEMKYVRIFIPCRQKEDRVPGLYDLVEKKFYANEGSGIFKYDSGHTATVTIPVVEHVKHQLTTDYPWMTSTTSATQTVYTVDRGGFSVMVKFVADENYRIEANGEKTWTHTEDVVFGTTEGFALPTIEKVPGMVLDPWRFGETVVAYTNRVGELVIDGKGAMADLKSAEDVPWNPAVIKLVTIGDEVTSIGKYAFEGMSKDVTIAGVPLSLYKKTSSAYVGGPTIPADQVLVSREALQAAKAETISIANGEVKLGVSVRTCEDITAPVAEWTKAEETILTIPVKTKQGFMILQSSDASSADL